MRWVGGSKEEAARGSDWDARKKKSEFLQGASVTIIRGNLRVLDFRAAMILHGTGTRNWDLAGPKPESDSWFLIPAGIPEFGYSGY